MTQASEIWLKVASGGHWSIAELRAELPEYEGRSLDNATRQLASRGFLEVVPEAGVRRFRVTAACSVPGGLTVRVVMDAVGAPLRQDLQP